MHIFERQVKIIHVKPVNFEDATRMNSKLRACKTGKRSQKYVNSATNEQDTVSTTLSYYLNFDVSSYAEFHLKS